MESPAALQGLRILDFSRVLAGPFATMMLADLGAAVTKVERPDGGDETRAWGPPFDETGAATYFQSVNRNKESVVLDLRDGGDLDRARSLAAEADVLVENFRPGVMESLGLSYEQLGGENPRLVYCSITGFGREAGAEMTGYDLLVQALGGLMSITGIPEGEPQKVGVALVDVLAGLFASVGILAALRHRDATGEGQRVEVDLLTSLLAALVNQGAAHTVAGEVPQRMGNDHPSIAPYGLLRCGDGELVVAVGNERQFGLLCEALDEPGLAADPRFASNALRVENREALRERLEQLLRPRTAAAWATVLTGASVPAGVVNDVAAAFELARRLGLEPVVGLAREDGSEVSLTRNPISLSATPPTARAPQTAGPPAADRLGLTWLDGAKVSVRIGYKASAEQFGPRELLDLSVEAESRGMEIIAVSDHFQPWRHHGGHGPSALTWLGAAGEAMRSATLGTSVLTPTLRYHPSIIAQAFATLGSLYPGRIYLGVGSGEAMNETPATGREFPGRKERRLRLAEAIALIRRLFTEERVDFSGEYYETARATIYDRPEQPVPIFVAASGPLAAKLAGRLGDGFICTSGKDPELYETLLGKVAEGAEAAGREPAQVRRMIEIKVSYDRDRAYAEAACRWWAALALTPEQKEGIEDPIEMERLADSNADRAHTRFIVSDDPDEVVDRIGSYLDLGFEDLLLHAPGEDQRRFLAQFSEDVLPALRDRARG